MEGQNDAPQAAPNTHNIVSDELGVQCQAMFREFLEDAREEVNEGEDVRYTYREQLSMLKNNEKTTFIVDIKKMKAFNEELYRLVVDELQRVMPFLQEAATEFGNQVEENGAGGEKHYWISFYGEDELVFKIRELKTSNIGQLSVIKGTVVRTSEIRPELIAGHFVCGECQTVIPNVKQQFKYTQPKICPHSECANRTEFQLIVDKSRFVDWQRIRIQELSSEIPSGSMPRSMDVLVRHEGVDQAKAGDRVTLTGSLIVVPDVKQMSRGRGAGQQQDGFGVDGITGLKVLGLRDMSYKLSFLACTTQNSNSGDSFRDIRSQESRDTMLATFTEDERTKIIDMANDTRIYHNITASLCPTIHGHENIKRGILLMLLGGVHKTTLEKTKIRGDINCCIVGDPSTAKSQFLKYVSDFLPRAVYTSGKASSAAGLTASVKRDEDTGEFCIEAGALMLADNGICCIDEFDKMDVKDQVAIHEAMEQQTISIAKAGIKATLNAATSILAACNPLSGRYDHSKTLRGNVAMSSAIMSRFDLFFIVTDQCNDVADYNIANHIVSFHQLKAKAIEVPYTMREIQCYIKFARTVQPTFTEEAKRLLPELYTQLRERFGGGMAGDSSFPITVRQLESLIRLSEALARLHLTEEIKVEHVRHAFQLIDESILTVERGNVDLNAYDKSDDIFEAGMARDEADSQNQTESENLTITHEQYEKIKAILVRELQTLTERGLVIAQDLGEEDNYQGVPIDDLHQRYMDILIEEGQVDDEASRDKNLRIGQRVIELLIEREGIFLSTYGHSTEEEEPQEDQQSEDMEVEHRTRYLFIHPNYQE